MPKLKPSHENESAPEFIVAREFFDQFFERPLPQSSFQDLVKKGRIIPWTHMRGRFLANESLRRLGLPKITQMPEDVQQRSLEDLIRFGFTLIDDTLFGPPSWLLSAEKIDLKEGDHARRIADHYRGNVNSLDGPELKLAYFGGVLDAEFLTREDATRTNAP